MIRLHAWTDAASLRTSFATVEEARDFARECCRNGAWCVDLYDFEGFGEFGRGAFGETHYGSSPDEIRLLRAAGIAL